MGARALGGRAWEETIRAVDAYQTSSATFPVIGMTVLGVIFGVAQVAGVAPLPGDAATYWLTPVSSTVGYPPLLLQVLVPIRATDQWQVFVVAWTTLCMASLGYVLGPLAFVETGLLIPDVLMPGAGQWWAGPIDLVLLGNVMMPMVAAIVLAMRHPGWWAVPILTKVTVGVGVLWLAFRGEWRRFAIAIGVTAAVGVVSLILAPDGWISFVGFASANATNQDFGPGIVGPPLWARLPVAVVLLWVAAKTNRPRLVPIACATAIAGLYGLATFTAVACAAISPRLYGLATPDAPPRSVAPTQT